MKKKLKRRRRCLPKKRGEKNQSKQFLIACAQELQCTWMNAFSKKRCLVSRVISICRIKYQNNHSFSVSSVCTMMGGGGGGERK